MLSPSKKFNKIQLPVSQFAGSKIYTQGGYSGYQVTGKIKWGQKSTPPPPKELTPSASNKTQKNPGHAELPNHKSLFAELRSRDVWELSRDYLVLNTHKKIPT